MSVAAAWTMAVESVPLGPATHGTPERRHPTTAILSVTELQSDTMASKHPDAGDEVATAVGRYALREVSLGRAAESAGMTRWEFEELLEQAGFDALYGPRTVSDLEAEIATARRLEEE